MKKQVDQGHPVRPHCIPKRYTSAVREMTWSALLAATSLVAHCVAVYISLVPNLLFLVCRAQQRPLEHLEAGHKAAALAESGERLLQPPEHHESENRRGRRHDAKPHEPKVSPASNPARMIVPGQPAACQDQCIPMISAVEPASAGPQQEVVCLCLAAHLLRHGIIDGQAICVICCQIAMTGPSGDQAVCRENTVVSYCVQ